jgi:hypothetical protein
MKLKHLAVPVVALCLVGVGFTDSAEAAHHHRAKTKVTIAANGTDFAGKVKSKKPAKCANGRTVYLMLVLGKRGGGNDSLFASTTASWANGAYRWHIDGLDHTGKFYAKVLRTPQCKPNSSKTVTAHN